MCVCVCLCVCVCVKCVCTCTSAADLSGWKQKLRDDGRGQGAAGDEGRVVGGEGGGDSGLDSSDSDQDTATRQQHGTQWYTAR